MDLLELHHFTRQSWLRGASYVHEIRTASAIYLWKKIISWLRLFSCHSFIENHLSWPCCCHARWPWNWVGQPWRIVNCGLPKKNSVAASSDVSTSSLLSGESHVVPFPPFSTAMGLKVPSLPHSWVVGHVKFHCRRSQPAKASSSATKSSPFLCCWQAVWCLYMPFPLPFPLKFCYWLPWPESRPIPTTGHSSHRSPSREMSWIAFFSFWMDARVFIAGLSNWAARVSPMASTKQASFNSGITAFWAADLPAMSSALLSCVLCFPVLLGNHGDGHRRWQSPLKRQLAPWMLQVSSPTWESSARASNSLMLLKRNIRAFDAVLGELQLPNCPYFGPNVHLSVIAGSGLPSYWSRPCSPLSAPYLPFPYSSLNFEGEAQAVIAGLSSLLWLENWKD